MTFDEALFLGFTDSPFAVLVKPDDPDTFSGLGRREERSVRLAFAPDNEGDAEAGEWALVEGDGDVLRLASPPAFDGILLGDGDEGVRRRRSQKVLAIAVGEETMELVFEPLPTDERGVDVTPTDYSSLARRRHADPTLTYRRRREQTRPGWTVPAVRRLVRLLADEGWPHAAVIVEAARLGGFIDREAVYAVAEYQPSRTLRGFTKPVKRIQRRLVSEGRIPPDTPDALNTIYDHGVLATRFQVPAEFQAALAGWRP